MRTKPFAVFDIDGTLIRWQLYHAIADQLFKLGYISPGKFSLIKNARMNWKRREHRESFKEYETKLVELYSEILKDLSVNNFIRAVDLVFNEYKDQAYTYTRELIKDLKEQGYLLFAISGSQNEIVEKIAKHYGFDDYVGQDFVQQNGHFTGEVIVPVGKKHEVLEEMIKKHSALRADSYGVGDSAGDASMLNLVDNPIALNPEKKLYDIASQEGWKIVIERKNMVYELEKEHGRYYLAKTN